MLKSIFLFALLVGLAAGQEPPPFGTVIEQWNLPMSGAYAGAGITWRQDEDRFYLMDQGYQGPHWVWKMHPSDPLGTLERVPCRALCIRGDSTPIRVGIAWDSDSGCFWTGAILDRSIYGYGYVLRYVWNGDSLVWPGTARDSWMVGDGGRGGGLQTLFIAGMEKSPRDGRFYGIPVDDSLSVQNFPVRFDPYLKVNYGRVAHGDTVSERGLTLVPYDSNYILTCGWNSCSYRKRDSTGYLLAEASAGWAVDWALHIPQVIRPDDTVCAYCITSTPTNTLQRVSLGMVWSQLVSVGLEERRPTAHSRPPTATVCRGSLVLPRTLEPWTPWTLVSITGRKVTDLQPGENDIRHVAPGVYFIQRNAVGGRRQAANKVLIAD
jgi:hypothetical protein